MRLEIGYSSDEKEASPDNVRAAIAGLTDEDDNFVILERGDGVFIQVAGCASDSFQLEYREGSDDSHFQAAESPTEEQVQSAFASFLGGTDDYKSAIRWEPQGSGAPAASTASPGAGSSPSTDGPSLSDLPIDELKKSVGCTSVILFILTIVGAVASLSMV